MTDILSDILSDIKAVVKENLRTEMRYATVAFFATVIEKNVVATDLLSDGKQKLSLKRDEAVAVNVKGYSAVVLKFKA